MYTAQQPATQRSSGRRKEPVTAFYLPQVVIDVCAHRTLAVALYTLIARLWIGNKAAVALPRPALQAYDPTITTRRIVNAMNWLMKQKLITSVKIGGRNHYVPMYLLRNGTSIPWSDSTRHYGRPNEMPYVVVPFRLFEGYLGTITPHSHAPAEISRYTTQPLLSLDDLGAYIINMLQYTRGKKDLFVGTAKYPYDSTLLFNHGLLAQRENGFVDVVDVPSLDVILQRVMAQSWGNPQAVTLTTKGQTRIGLPCIQIAPADETVPAIVPLLKQTQLVGLSLNDVIRVSSSSVGPANQPDTAPTSAPEPVGEYTPAVFNQDTYDLLIKRECYAAHLLAHLPYDAVAERLNDHPDLRKGALTLNFRADPPTTTRIQRYKEEQALQARQALEEQAVLAERAQKEQALLAQLDHEYAAICKETAVSGLPWSDLSDASVALRDFLTTSLELPATILNQITIAYMDAADSIYTLISVPSTWIGGCWEALCSRWLCQATAKHREQVRVVFVPNTPATPTQTLDVPPPTDTESTDAPWPADWTPTTVAEAHRAMQTPTWWGSDIPPHLIPLVEEVVVLSDGQRISLWPPSPADTIVLVVKDETDAQILRTSTNSLYALIQSIADCRTPLDIAIGVGKARGREFIE